jgi:hypothetical protein
VTVAVLGPHQHHVGFASNRWYSGNAWIEVKKKRRKSGVEDIISFLARERRDEVGGGGGCMCDACHRDRAHAIEGEGEGEIERERGEREIYRKVI